MRVPNSNTYTMKSTNLWNKTSLKTKKIELLTIYLKKYKHIYYTTYILLMINNQ